MLGRRNRVNKYCVPRDAGNLASIDAGNLASIDLYASDGSSSLILNNSTLALAFALVIGIAHTQLEKLRQRPLLLHEAFARKNTRRDPTGDKAELGGIS